MKKNTEYYAVIEGRIEEPTIFTSWYSILYQHTPLETDWQSTNRGDAHPRVTGCSNLFKGVRTLEEACEYMETHGIYHYRKEIKQTALDTTPRNQKDGFYAVANGKNPGIYPIW